MKRLSIWMIMSSWIIYVLVPIIYKFIYGNYPKNIVSLGYVPEEYMTKAAIIITLVFFLSVFLIQCIPESGSNIIGTLNCSLSYYYLTVLIFILFAVNAGVLDFRNASTGGLNSTVFAYYTLFFYPAILFLIFLFCVKNEKNILLLCASYLVLTIISHSRSGAVHLAVYLIGFAFVSSNFSAKQMIERTNTILRKYKKQIKLLVIFLLMISPLVFIHSTNSRSGGSSVVFNKAIEIIAARCSCLDESGLALYRIEMSSFQNSIFLEKYSLLHQVECIIDSSIPGSLFGEDVDPNQYYRAMVGYMSSQDASRFYTSVNLMFPIYMVMKYGTIMGILFSVLLIVFFFIAVLRVKNPIWQVILVCIVFREFLYFFDWVMVWKSLVRCACTIISFDFLTRHVRIGIPNFRIGRVKLKFLWKF